MALNNHVEKFTLDMAPGGIAPVLNVSQGDTGRAYTADIYWGGASYDVSGLTVRLRGRKRDNTVFDYALPAPSGTTVSFDLQDKEQVTIIPGVVECELVFTDSSSRVVGTANFVFIIEEAPYDPDAPSESVVQGLVDLIEETVGGDISDEVDAWLAAHPEATTTVQDGAITKAKINAAFLPEIENAYVTPEMFGAVGDGTTDDTAALNEAFASEKNVVIDKPYFAKDDITISTNVIGTSAGKLILGKNVWVQTEGIHLSNIVFDGNNGCGFVRVRANDVSIEQCGFVNFADIEEYKYCIALLVGESNTHFTGITVSECFFDGATTNYDNSIEGDNVGSVRQILIDRADCSVHHCTFRNLSGYADGDNIHVRGAEITSGLEYPQSAAGYSADYQKVTITNNLIFMANKSAIKNQCSGTVIANNTIVVTGDNTHTMHSAIRSMASSDVKIIGNLVRHLSGTLTNVCTVEYGNRCIVSENTLEGAASTLSNIFRLVDNTAIMVSGNNVKTVSSARFEYGCYNSGIVSDNVFDCGVTLDGYVYLFNEGMAESSPPTNDQTLIIRGNTFKCSGSLRQFQWIFQNTVNLELDGNSISGTFTTPTNAVYKFHLANDTYYKIRIIGEMIGNAANIEISKSSDSRTTPIECTIEDSNITKIAVYNCSVLVIKRCKIGVYNSVPIDVYSDAAIKLEDCDCSGLTSGFISIHSANPTFDVATCLIRKGFNSANLFVSDNSYNLGGVSWHKNNASTLVGVDYTFTAANMLGFVFDAGAICYNNQTGGALVYYNRTWHDLMQS